MKNNKKILIVLGSVVMVLLMVSSSTAVNAAQKNKVRNVMMDTGHIFNQNIYLTRTKLPLLKIAQKQMGDYEFKNSLSHIIETIETKGHIGSTEINNILGSSGGIYSGKVDFYATFQGRVGGFPGALIDRIIGIYVGPWFYVTWGAKSGCFVISAEYGGLMGDSYNGVPHDGIAFGGFGEWSYHYYDDGVWNFDAEINGFSPLIIVST